MTSTIISGNPIHTFPQLWFDPIGSIIESPGEVLQFLRKWINDFKRDLVGLDDKSNLYYITDKLQRESASSPSRWPDILPAPDLDSSFVKLGKMGMGLITNVLGAPATHKLEGR